jgi:serine/threonine-protein kinase
MTREGASEEGLVRSELEKLLGSETFAQSESLKRFLRYVVEAKLEGREGELKEQVLGAEVFERGDAYDPRIDPIVRVQATRLRSKLRDYYVKEGARAELVIELPKGSYVPSFAKALSGERDLPPSRWKPLVAVAVVVAVAILIGSRVWNRAETPETASNPRSLAVLPFTDMSPERDHEYFGDGLAEEITTALASVEGLEVVPRTSAFRFKGERVDLRTIASELGVDALLQGSVRVSDRMLRAQAQLIRAGDGRQLWAETFDRPLEDAFEVQEAIARAVARAVERSLSHPRSEDQRYVPASGAYDDFLRATFERERNTPLSLARSIELFQSAIEKDPDFAPAHAGLVQAYVLNLLWGFAPPSETRESARKASDRALALAGDHPQALAAAASYRLIYEWDSAGAEELLGRGGDAEEIHLARGVLLAVRGRLDEAAREMELVLPVARHRPLPHYLGAAIAFHRGEYAAALERARAILEWAPDHPLTWLLLARIQDRLGRFEEAEAALTSFERGVEAPAVASGYRAVLLAHHGRTEQARTALHDLEEVRASGDVPPALLARVYASLHEVEPALEALEAAGRERSFSLLLLAIDPDYEPLRPDPRFRALVERLGPAVQ